MALRFTTALDSLNARRKRALRNETRYQGDHAARDAERVERELRAQRKFDLAREKAVPAFRRMANFGIDTGADADIECDTDTDAADAADDDIDPVVNVGSDADAVVDEPESDADVNVGRSDADAVVEVGSDDDVVMNVVSLADAAAAADASSDEDDLLKSHGMGTRAVRERARRAKVAAHAASTAHASLLGKAAAALDDEEAASSLCSRTFGALLSRLSLSATVPKALEVTAASGAPAGGTRAPKRAVAPSEPERRAVLAARLAQLGPYALLLTRQREAGGGPKQASADAALRALQLPARADFDHFSVPALRALLRFLHEIEPAPSMNTRSIFIDLLLLDGARDKHRARLESARRSREKTAQRGEKRAAAAAAAADDEEGEEPPAAKRTKATVCKISAALAAPPPTITLAQVDARRPARVGRPKAGDEAAPGRNHARDKMRTLLRRAVTDRQIPGVKISVLILDEYCPRRPILYVASESITALKASMLAWLDAQEAHNSRSISGGAPVVHTYTDGASLDAGLGRSRAASATAAGPAPSSVFGLAPADGSVHLTGLAPLRIIGAGARQGADDDLG